MDSRTSNHNEYISSTWPHALDIDVADLVCDDMRLFYKTDSKD